jgi:hypothetical protein
LPGSATVVPLITFLVGIPLAEVEIRMILATLRQVGDNKQLCAQLLQISTRTLYRRLRGRAFCSACGSTRDLPHVDDLACGEAAMKERELVASQITKAARETAALDRGVASSDVAPLIATGSPMWIKKENTKTVWSEDDADCGLPGHDTLDAAFKRLYKATMLDPLETWDAGDASFKLLPAGIVVVASYPGNSEIRELPMPMAKKQGVCCACGFSGEEETFCLRGAQNHHCEHWYAVSGEQEEVP